MRFFLFQRYDALFGVLEAKLETRNLSVKVEELYLANFGKKLNPQII